GRTGVFPPLYPGGCTPVWGVRGGGSNRRSSAAVCGGAPSGSGAAGGGVVPAFFRRCIRVGARRFGGCGLVGRTGVLPPPYPGGCTPVWGVRGGGSNRRFSAAVFGWVQDGLGGAGWWG